MTSSRKVLVIGAGTMGVQISQVLALNGYQVYLKGKNKNSERIGLLKIAESLQINIQKKKISEEDARSARKRIFGISSLTKIATHNFIFVIETIVENVNKKKLLLKKISAFLPETTIIASNTSSLSISKLASAVKFPQRFIGLHFFNPAQLISLVEVINGDQTSIETSNKTISFGKSLGKSPIMLRDSPGFLVNRMLIPSINEAVFILEAGIASKEDIDQSIKLGAKHPLGPLELADLIGLDICLSIMESLYEQFNDPKYRPSPLLIKMVQKKQLGRKTKKGFYDY